MAHTALPKSYKTRFPFRICSTSFVYPDSWAANVEMLAPRLDEIELLFFESGYQGALPSREEIEKIALLLKLSGTSCNVHLPLDISLGDADEKKRARSVETVEHVVDLVAPLSPTTHTLHLTYEEKVRSGRHLASWKKRLYDSLDKIFQILPPHSFTVENLAEYPHEWIDDIIADTGVRACLDIGHCIQRGDDFGEAFCERHEKIDLLHVYGVSPKKDHQSLKCLDKEQCDKLVTILNNFSGTVSVEVFSFDNLAESLYALEFWGNKGGW